MLKILVWGLMIYFVWHKVEQGHLSFGQIGGFFREIYTVNNSFVLLLPCFLVVLNWGLEARKWQLLAAPAVGLSLLQAVRAVLTGLSLGFITPRSLGDYAGRMLATPCEKRERLVGAVLLNRISQSLSTYVFGLSGIVCLWVNTSLFAHSRWLWMFLLLLVATIACFLFLGKGRFWVLKMLKWIAGHKVLRVFQIMGTYSADSIRSLLVYASLRYLVFSIQFVWILRLAGVDLSLPLLASGVAVVFLLKSVIPTFNFLSDLGVREFSALWVFSVFALPESQLVLASLLVWCLNILLPTLVGGILVLRLRLNRSVC